MIGNDSMGNASIVLVEDDEVDAEAVKREFKKRNIVNPLYIATSGIDALDLLRKQDKAQAVPRPLIMLVDINMPRMNGLEFLREVRGDEALKESVAFILTTSAREADVSAAYKLNAAGYFLKDNMKELMDVLSVYQRFNKFPTGRPDFV